MKPKTKKKSKKHSKIAIVIGTKAELIKCMPIMDELQKQNKDYWFIHTGQHPLGKACEEFGIKKPDFVLSEEPKISTKYWSKIKLNIFMESVRIMLKIRKLVKKLKPKYVIYHGDTMSTAMAAGASSNVLNPFNKSWQNVHLEAGLDSGSIFEPFPEEFTRRIIRGFTNHLFAVSDLSEKNLKKKRSFVGGKSMKVGNTIIDSVEMTYKKAKKRRFKKPRGKYFLINIHRYENLRSKKRLSQIVNIISHSKIKGIWPMHSNTKKHLIEYGFMKRVRELKNIEITPPVNYEKFLFLMANCEYIIADGGSIQEESLVFKKPYLVMRKFTERQEGIDTGINFLTKLDLEYSKKLMEKFESGKFKVPKFKNPYGEKGVSKKIIDELK
ncbi:UDP-N-acetylglucosamine 2-epimerase [Nanoarchaeota archaeon]